MTDHHPTDTEVVDALATYLGTLAEWSGADSLDVIADVLAQVRPHPGATPVELYPERFRAVTGREIHPHFDMRERNE